MKKHVLIAAVALLTTAGVTATVLGTSKKKETKKEKNCEYKKKKCTRSLRIASF